VKNSTSNFHLALINGQSSVTGCRYGFFTEFNKGELDWATTNHAPTNQFCIGDTVRLSADSVEGSTSTTYTWSGPNGYSAIGQYPYFIATNNQNSGVYTVNATTNSCPTEPLSLNLTVGSPSINLPPDTTICSNTPITLTPTGNYTSLLWSTGATTSSITVNTSGTYWVKASIGTNCTASDTIHITINQSGQFSLGNDTTICDTSHIVLNAPLGAYTLLWSTGVTTPSIDVHQTGLYWLEIDNDSICPYRDSINIVFVPIPAPNFGTDVTLCSGKSLVLHDGLNTGTSTWSTGEVGHSITINTSGTYWVFSSSATNCNNSDTVVVVTVQPTPFSLGLDTMICENQILILSPGPGFDSYEWSTGDTTSSITISQPGNYSVLVSEGSCESSDYINIQPCPCVV
jgi:hypothetical protein